MRRSIGLLLSLGFLFVAAACSSTHEARLPSDCNIPSLKTLLPTIDLMYKDKAGNSDYLSCSSMPLEKTPTDSKIRQRQWNEGINIWYSKGNAGGYTDAQIAEYDLEVVETNGCRVVTSQNPGYVLTSVAMCEGFVILIWMPDGTPWSFGAELASAAIVSLIK